MGTGDGKRGTIMSEEYTIYHLNVLYNPASAAASTTHVYTQIIANDPNAPWIDNSMTISISEYNALLSQFMARGDEITRLQAIIAELEAVFEVPGDEDKEEKDRLQAVVRNVTHFLRAKQDIGELSAVEEALLLECSRAMARAMEGTE